QSAIPIYFHQLTLSSDNTSSQSAIAEQSNIDNKHFSDNLNILDYRGNAYKGAETGNDTLHNNFSFFAFINKKNYTCHCSGCTVISKNYKEYLAHRKTHGQPFIYECKLPGCGRTFGQKSSFYNHIQTHEPRPQCECCGKFLVNRNALKKHKRLCQIKFHERSYECLYPGCAMVMKSRNEYITHRKTHGQPFIYECRAPDCGRIFNYKTTLP
ncbi:unnamed protein product, partial [Brugia pahangi]|uniref:Zinc finger protein n=1 Tax=Brugia pahangi TaxID=6280 RepID=A0A0N4T4C5_BRUPA